MAFNYRAAEENFIAALPSKVADLYFDDYYNESKETFQYLNKHFAFNLNFQAKEYIATRGIRLSPFASVTHPHPICKIFENHFLFNVLPNYIKPKDHVAIFSMKQNKSEYLYFRAREFTSELVNRFLTPTDHGRYPKSSVVSGGFDSFQLFVHNLKLRFNVRSPNVLFFHDELMYWSARDFSYFLARIQPEVVAFSYVFPPEILVGEVKSCNSLAYKFEIVDGDVVFFPDGSKNVPYVQPLSGSWPLSTNSIRVGSDKGILHYTLDLVEQHGAHSFFVCKLNCKIKQKRRFFGDFDCMSLKNFKFGGKTPSLNGVVRASMLSKIFNYMSCLKKKDCESALAKLRQLTEGRLLEDELIIVHDVARVLSSYNLASESSSFIDWIDLRKLRSNLNIQSDFLDFLFGGDSKLIKEKIRQFSSQIKPLSFNLVCDEISFDFSGKLENRLDNWLLGDSLNAITPLCRPIDNDATFPFDDSSSLASSTVRADEQEDNSVTNFEIEDPQELELIDVGPSMAGDQRREGKQTARINDCFFEAVCSTMGLQVESCLSTLLNFESSEPLFKSLVSKINDDKPLLMAEMTEACKALNWRVWIYLPDEIIKLNENETLRPVSIGGREGHVFKLTNLDFFKCIGLLEKAYFELYGSIAQVSSYIPSVRRARNLLDSLSTMMLGLLIDKKKVNEGKVVDRRTLDEFEREGFPFSKVNVLPFLGFAGSGKTRTLFSLLNSSFLKVPFIWICPRKKIVQDLCDKIDSLYGSDQNVGIKKNFITHEKGLLLSHVPNLIILDEISLFPPGYLDLLLCKKGVNENTSVAILGDTLQCKFHCSDSILMAKNESDLSLILKSRMNQHLRTDYLAFSHRFGSHSMLQDFSGIQDRLPLTVLRLKEPSEDTEAILCASERDKRNLGADTNLKVMTIGESQGCTFKRASLVLTDCLNLSDIGTVITGITRASEVLEIVCDPIKAEMFLTYKRGANNCALIMTQNSSQIANLCKPLLHGLNLVKFTSAGAEFELKLEGDPFLKSMLNMVEREEIPVIEFPEVELDEAFPKTHLPLVESNAFEIECLMKIRAREYREFWMHNVGWSTQFEDTLLSKNEANLFSPCLNPQNIFPRHKADDSVTFWAAVKKRLLFSNPGTQLRKFKEARSKGRDILRIFLKHVPIANNLEPAMYEEAILDFEEKKVSKSTAMIANHAIRSDTDWNTESIFLFMKSQLCKKKEKMYCDAKAGQTLACFAHSVLVKFSGLSRYIEKKVNQSLPSNFYIHQKKDFRLFENWVKENNFDGVCTESDYEAFDASQDHVALAFEVALMEYLAIPPHMIEDYIYIKTHLNCKLGEFAIMRFTGEFCTFLFNTLVNMAFTFLKYDIKSSTSICFAGDDMCANQRLGLNSSNLDLLNSMSLKAKVDFTRTPTFCGWYLSKYGIIKNPFLMCARLENAIYKKELNLVIDSYFLEFCFSYEKKDILIELLSERELDFHFLLTRFFVKKANLLKGSARSALLATKERDHLFFGEASSFGSSVRDFASNAYSKWTNPISSLLDSEMLGIKKRYMDGANPMSLESLLINQTKIPIGSFKSSPIFSIIKGDLHLTKETCQLSQPRNFLSSPVELIRKSSLMELTSQKFTQILASSNPSQLMSSSDFRSTSLYQFNLNQVKLASMCPSLTQWRQIQSETSKTSTAYYISQQFFSLSLACFLQASRLLGRCTFLTLEALRCVLPSRMASNLTLAKCQGLIISTARTTWCPSLTQSFKTVSNCVLNLKGSSWNLVLKLFLLTSASCIGCSTTPMTQWLMKGSKLLDFKSCKLATKFQTLVSSLLSIASNATTTLNWKIWERKKLFQNAETLWGRCRRKVADLEGIKPNPFPTILSLVNLKLIRIWTSFCIHTLVDLGHLIHPKFLLAWLRSGSREMAASQILSETIRLQLRDYLWANIVDPQNALHLIPAANAHLTPAEEARKNLILDHFLKNLFGNIAVEGASDKVSFLPMAITLTPIPAARLDLAENYVITHNLRESVGAIKAWRDNHQSETIRSLTFRAICKPFADQAMDFLLENPNVRTNLYFTQPHNYGKAPEVAFDFANGLSANRLANNRDRQFVISALASRTFNHEAKKGVFEAQGAINFSFDG